MYVVYIFPPDGRVTPAYFLLVTAATLLTSFGTTAMFVSQGAFFARISDSKVGGSYQTLLATCSNFGGTWPKYFVLKLVDHFTIAKCSTTGQDCVTELGKAACRNSFASDQTPGVCLIIQEGFYYVSLICIICGSLLYLLFVRPTAKYLERLDVSVWKISN
jgi:PAT family acetyl-CoA transporter-like MFS transporter 1